MVKNLPANTEAAEDLGSIPGLGRFPGGRNGNPLQYSSLENPMDRGAWKTTVHGVARVGHNLPTKQPQLYVMHHRTKEPLDESERGE